MKLYPIIFEGARTPEEALEKGIAAVQVAGSVIVLFSVNRVLETTKKFLKKSKLMR